MLEATITDSQNLPLSIAATDKRGNPTTVGPAGEAWLVDNPNVATVTPAPDGMSAVLSAAGPVGDVTVTVNATAGGVAVTGNILVHVVPGAPVTIDIKPGSPVDQP